MTATAAVNPFFRLSQRLRDNIVSRLGWRSLRPVQELSIDPLIEGNNALVLAPTAGGKTEAAVFPLLSRIADEGWRGLSVLYVCPLRALLNNLYPRVEGYCELLGHRAATWHGDVGDAERKRMAYRIQDILREEQPYTFFMRRTRYASFPSDILGVEFAPVRPQLLTFPWYRMD